MNKKVVIIYHANCRDGFSAAWAAWKKFGNRAHYLPIEHHTPVPPLKGKEVYMLDITFLQPALEKLMRDNARVTSIDHHISRIKETKMTYKYSYALHNSGAVLAWKYFHPGKKVPIFLRYIEDEDLWAWKLKDSKEILAYIELFDQTFVSWNKIAKDLENARKRKAYIAKGKIMTAYFRALMEDVAASAEKVDFAGWRVCLVNASQTFVSDVGNLLAQKHSPFAIVWRQQRGIVKVSLRGNGTIDVAKIAARYGGGGHYSASGFSFPATGNFPWKPISSRKSIK